MMDQGIAKKYAGALIDTCKNQHIMDRVEKEFTALQELLHKDSELKSFLLHPLVNGDDKIKTLQVVGKDFHPYLLNLLQLLARKKRLNLLDSIYDSFLRLLFSSRGYLLAEVFTPLPLEDEQRKSLQQVLTQRFGRQVKLQVTVSPQQKGGMTIRVGDLVFDGSVKTILKKAYQHLLTSTG